MITRAVNKSVNEGLERIKPNPWWAIYSVPFHLTFPAADEARDVAHLLDVIPDGFLVVYADALVTAEPGVAWTPTLAFLRAGAVNAQAIVIFYTLREEIHEA